MGAAGPWFSILVSIAICCGLLLLLFLRNHRYFYIDDRIAETVPKFVDIGRLLLAGEWPWLTTNIVNGGAYAVEYLNGVYNPLNLVLCIVMAKLDDVALGSFIYVLAHCCILAGSGAWAGRSLGLNNAWSVALGVSIGFQPYTIVWNASAWSQGLIAFAWLSLAVAAAISFHLQAKRRDGWILLFATYGCLTSGWPVTIVVLGVFMVALALARFVSRLPLGDTIWLCVWFASGVACSMVAIFPLLTAFEVASRRSAIANIANFNVATLEGLLQFANPAYYGFFHNWGGYKLQNLPHFYAAWFLLPVFVAFKALPTKPEWRVLVWVLLASVAVSALLALGPERLLVFRFPNRAIQFTNFFLVLLGGVLLAGGQLAFTARRLAVLVGLIGLMALLSLQADPAGYKRIALFIAIVLALSMLLWMQESGPESAHKKIRALTRARPSLWAVPLGTTGVVALLAWVHPSGRGVDWGFPHQVSSLRPVSARDYTLFYGNYFPPESTQQAYEEYRFSTTGLTVGDRQINGYSSLGNRHFRRFFRIDDHGNFAPGRADLFSGTDAETGLQFLELFRIDQIIAIRGPMDDELGRVLGPAWRREREGQVAAVYRHGPYSLPGLLSYAAPGLRVGEGACVRTASRECVKIEDPGQGGRLIFARLWVPGYRATLDGVPIPVERYANTLVSVTVPGAGASVLELSYRPPGLRLFGLIALIVLAGLGLATYLGRRKPGLADPSHRE